MKIIDKAMAYDRVKEEVEFRIRKLKEWEKEYAERNSGDVTSSYYKEAEMRVKACRSELERLLRIMEIM